MAIPPVEGDRKLVVLGKPTSIPIASRQVQQAAARAAGGLIGFAVMYVVIAHLLALTTAGPFEGFVQLRDVTPVRVAFWTLSLIALGVLPPLRRRLLAQRPGVPQFVRIQQVFNCAVTTGFVAAPPAILGFVLVALNGLYIDLYALSCLSLLTMIVYFPREDAWNEWVGRRR